MCTLAETLQRCKGMNLEIIWGFTYENAKMRMMI